MKFLILGGSGYLGSKVIDKLTEDGHTIVTTRRDNSDISRVHSHDVIWIPAKTEAVKTAMSCQTFDWVLNMVCNYGKNHTQYNDCIEANLQFPLEILDLAREFKIPNYLTIGTGLPSRFNMYTMTKEMFSEFGKFYAQKHGINFLSVQLEMFYGADEPKDRFLPAIIQKCRNNEDVKVTIGTQHRDIIAIQDVIDAILFIINIAPKGYNEIPLGVGEAPSMREIVEFIHHTTNSKSKVYFGAIPMRENEPDCVADVSKLKKMGFSCKWSWKTGLQKMIQEIDEVNKKEITKE
ncbi:MAG: NAD(P)-dependent oxidoreductase [Lachnospiraceae bacterium]|nr:NAD(P)-dependent oxidoreductase [Lachnospiraceae bacterium]